MARFEDIVGQEAMKEHFRNILASGKNSHAYLFCGEKSSGKEFVARVFAMALQCQQSRLNPCQECHSCRQALSKNHPDIITLHREKPGTISVEEVREQISQDVHIKPYSGPYKIYIVPEAQKMTVQAQNALLKTLEEPPDYVVILLLADSAHTILPTVQSRCVQLLMKPVPEGRLKAHLMENLGVPDYKAAVCAAFARGNVGRAKDLARNEDFEQLRQHAIALAKHGREMDVTEIMAAVGQMEDGRLGMDEYLDMMAAWYRDVLLFKATQDGGGVIFKDELPSISEAAKRSSYGGLEEVLQAIEKAKIRLRANVQAKLAMELLFLEIREKG